MDDLTPYGQERWTAGSQWKPGLKPDGDQAEGPKPFHCFDCGSPVYRTRGDAYHCFKCGVGYADEIVEQHFRRQSKKPFLTAADLVLLRKMKISLC